MNVIMLLEKMGEEIGVRYLPSKIHEIIDYTSKMLDNGRIITLSDESGLLGVMYFSVTDDYEPFLKKGEFEFKSHDPEAKTIYVEKMISRKWNKEIRLEFEKEVMKRYPWVNQCIGHRRSKNGDRKVLNKRRLKYVSN